MSEPSLHLAHMAFPAEEREAIQVINSNLWSLNTYIDDFRASLALFEYSLEASTAAREQRKNSPFETRASLLRTHFMYAKWQHIAARDAVMNIYHWGRARDGINMTLGGCPTLRGMLGAPMGAANKLFDFHFPDYVKMRHGIAHIKETGFTPQAMERHAITEPFTLKGVIRNESTAAKVLVGGALDGRIYSCTWEGDPISCEISEATASKMEEVRNAYYQAFNEAAAWARSVAFPPAPRQP
jgi:hypothetical protein